MAPSGKRGRGLSIPAGLEIDPQHLYDIAAGHLAASQFSGYSDRLTLPSSSG
jgi:hypothetical protein